MQKPGRGGYREGAGRKPSGNRLIKVTVGFTEEQMRFVAKVADENWMSKAEAIRLLVDSAMQSRQPLKT